MVQLDAEKVRRYLEARFGGPVRVVSLSGLGQEPGAGELKGYGYGAPVKVDYELSGQRHAAVLETVTPGPFGHEHMADRAQILLWSHAAFNRLPRHVRSLDVGGFSDDGSLVSVGNIDEFFILNEFVPGDGYYRDLERLCDGGDLQDEDLARVDALCDYLVEIHRVRGSDPSLYVRRTRELVGHHECIMGILDSYPPAFDGGSAGSLREIERALVDWRWRLKACTHRLRQRRYLEATGDDELHAVIGPFFAFRGLVVANPIWYPRLAPGIRAKLLSFVRAVLDQPRFDPSCVNAYCAG
jgi:hypothetical protein